MVILDEATSAMDADTEDAVMCAVMQRLADKTVVMVTHRLNIARGFDKIIRIDTGGKVDL